MNAKKSFEFSPCGLATGVGSLPFVDPAKAVSFVRRYFTAIPHWPQLPLRGTEENFVFQFLRVLVETGLIKIKGGVPCFDTADPAWPDRLTRFYTIFLAAEEGDSHALQSFALPRDNSKGFYAFLESIERTGPRGIRFFKGHMVGPLTAGFHLKDDRGRMAYYRDELRDVLVKTLAMHARWQAVTLSGLGRPAIIFVDDPGISAYGSYLHITLTREMILEDFNSIFAALHSENARVGLHSCNNADWSVPLQSNLDILSLDAYWYGDSILCYAVELLDFLERGGVLAWGIVPTMERAFEEDSHSLLLRLEHLWSQLERFGLNRETLLKQSMITPACGTGLLSPELAERIYRLTCQVSEALASMC
ncbi:hypothetical protein [Desulforhabdus amnigena]|uniref:Methionine synthase n=1 Tax=Desulforhabdus amnigena TaxID=40218 RepID=A0A9W6FV42_9BACT|nr:hypothetical protein [Desulforhabdus amnigena]GLI35387.1 hypothetical protein DAMNIGENAA_28200 [Desulforhabdus amnigena]